MAERYNNTLCVRANELISFDAKRKVGSEKGFLKEPTYNKMTRCGYLNVIKRGGPGFSALVEFETMRRDVKDKYIELNGDPRTSEGVPSILESAIRPDEVAYSYFEAYRYGDNGDLCLPKERGNNKVDEYTINARVLNALIKLKNNKRTMSIGGGSTKINVWAKLCQLSNDLRDKQNSPYPHTLPANPARLKAKALQYEKEKYQCLIHKNFGNRAAAVIDNGDKEAVIHRLLSNHTNLDNEQVRMMFNMIAAKMNWKKVSSVNTISNWRVKFNKTTLAGRRGTAELRNTMTMQIHRSAPKSPLFYWTLDGWDVELLYQRVDTKNGRNTTTYHHRLTVVVVLDPCKKYPIGYAIGSHESPALIRQALRNAAAHVQELFGARYKPFQLQSDNYQKKLMVPFYEAMSKYYTPAALKNAKSKVVEPYFLHLNKTYCQLQKNWSGFGITSDKNKQPNTEVINNHRKFIPDEFGCYAQIEAMMEMERKMKIGAYMKAWNNTSNEDKILFPDAEYLTLMGEATGWTNSLEGNGLGVTINGEKLFYESFDERLRDHMNENWIVRYDEHNLDTILISNATRLASGRVGEEIGTLKFLLNSVMTVPMALKEQRPEHFEYRAKVAAFNKNMEAGILDKMTKVQDTVDELFESNPQLENTLAKLVICDSRGQHKDERNADRIESDQATKMIKNKKAAIKVEASDEEWSFDASDFISTF